MKKARDYFIPDLGRSWKYLSNVVAAITGLLAAAYQYLPAVQQYFPQGWVKWAALAIILGRVLNQTPSTPKE